MDFELRDGVVYYAGTNTAPDLSSWPGYHHQEEADYHHQEEAMPTNLPEDFKGITPNTDDGPNAARSYDKTPLWAVFVGLIILVPLLALISVSLLWATLWLLTDMP